MLNQMIKNGKICYFWNGERVTPSKFFKIREVLSNEKKITGTKTGTF